MSKVPNTSAIKSSPVRPSAQGSQRFAASQLDASDMKSLLASDLHCHWVGPMPVETFFETFLDIGQEPPSQLGALPNDYFDAMPHTKKEPEMYPPFVRLPLTSVSNLLGSLCFHRSNLSPTPISLLLSSY